MEEVDDALRRGVDATERAEVACQAGIVRPHGVQPECERGAQRVDAEVVVLHVQRVGVHSRGEAKVRAHAVRVETVLAIALPVDGEYHSVRFAPAARMSALHDGVRTDALQIRDDVGRVQAFAEEGCADAVVLHGRLREGGKGREGEQQRSESGGGRRGRTLILPAVVGPEPVGRVGLNAFFHFFHIVFCDGEGSVAFFWQAFEGGAVIAPPDALHIYIIIDGSDALPDGLRTGDDGRVLIEPCHPVVSALRTLVGNESHDDFPACSELIDNDAVGVFHRHVLRSALPAVAPEDAVEHGVVKGMVNL